MVGEQSAASHAIGHALRWSVWLASVVKSASSSARILGWISVALAFASTIERSHFSLSQQHVPSALTACPSEGSPHRLPRAFLGALTWYFFCALVITRAISISLIVWWAVVLRNVVNDATNCNYPYSSYDCYTSSPLYYTYAPYLGR